MSSVFIRCVEAPGEHGHPGGPGSPAAAGCTCLHCESYFYRYYNTISSHNSQGSMSTIKKKQNIYFLTHVQAGLLFMWQMLDVYKHVVQHVGLWLNVPASILVISYVPSVC